uniref:Metaxin-1 n=1 Tax=Bos taurus TaxID=9913 RepID=F1N1D6_BOVIN
MPDLLVPHSRCTRSPTPGGVLQELCLPFGPVMERSSQYHTGSSPTFEKRWRNWGINGGLRGMERRDPEVQCGLRPVSPPRSRHLGLHVLAGGEAAPSADAKNYVEVTRKWYAEAMPFPLNFFLPGRMQRQYMERLQLLCGEHRPEDEEELEKELYQEAQECLTLLSQRLGSQKFFFGDAPASLDAFVFSYLALLQQAKLPSGKLQAHLRGLHNLCAYCAHILSLYFPWEGAKAPPPRQTPANPETEEEPYRRRNQILTVLAGLAAMAGYALLSGIVSIQRAPSARAPGTQALGMAEEDEEE